MRLRRRSTNPFYVVLVLVGAVLCVTACAYGVVAVKQLHAVSTPNSATQPDAGFVAWVDQYGPTLLILELVVLGIATVAAIGTDRFWTGGEN